MNRCACPLAMVLAKVHRQGCPDYNQAEVGKTACRHGVLYDGPDCDRCEADEAAWKPTGKQGGA